MPSHASKLTMQCYPLNWGIRDPDVFIKSFAMGAKPIFSNLEVQMGRDHVLCSVLIR